jgi:dolichol-phosphate mannosyltransferase
MARELVFTATYDEAANIESWIRQVAAHRPEADMLIVDDSSPDGTADVIIGLQAEFPQVTLHSRSGKLGLSSAHLFAMTTAQEMGYDRLITMDADGSHQPSQIGGLVDALGPAQFVIGTRTHGGTHQGTPMRRILSGGANTAARIILPMGLTEYTTSFRVFDREALTAVLAGEHRDSGYAFFIECLEDLHRAGIRMAERPIDFLDRAGGVSKIPRNQIWVSVGALARLGRQRRFPERNR